MSGWGDLATKLVSKGWNCPTCLVVNDEAAVECPCCETRNPAAPKAAPKAVAPAPFAFGAGTGAPGGVTFGFGTAEAGSGAEAAPPASAAAAPTFSFGFGAVPAPSAPTDAAAGPAPPAAAAAGFNFGFGAAAATAPAAPPPAASEPGPRKEKNVSSDAYFVAEAAAAASDDGGAATAAADAAAGAGAAFDDYEFARPLAVAVPADVAAANAGAAPRAAKRGRVAPAAPAAPAAAAAAAAVTTGRGRKAAAAVPPARLARGGKRGDAPAAAAAPAEAAVADTDAAPHDSAPAAAPAAGASSAAATAAATPAAPTSALVCVSGSGECDQLGLGAGAYAAETFTPVPRLARLAIARLAVGGLHTLALTADGALWSWGCNDDCALGRGGAEDLPGRVRVGGGGGAGGGWGVPLATISAGDSHSVGVDGAGRVWAWGTYKGADGYLGFSADGAKKAAAPVELASVHGAFGPIAAVSSGADHTAALTAGGVVVAWGAGGQGQLGKATTARELRGGRTAAVALTPYPLHVRRPRDVAAAAGGGGGKRARGGAGAPAAGTPAAGDLPAAAVWCVGYATFVLTAGAAAAGGGRLFACGLNNYGQLGLGDTGDRATPEEVVALRGAGVVGMAGGAAHALAVTGAGAVFAWGRGDSGQLGLSRAGGAARIPVAAAAFAPLRVPAHRFGGARVLAVAANSCSSAAITADGGLFAWGFGESGQLGTGRGADENAPVRVAGGALAGSARALAVGVGGQHAVVLVAGGAAAAAVASLPPDAVAVVEEPVKEDDGEGDEGEGGEGSDEGDGGDGLGGSDAGGDGGDDVSSGADGK